MDKDLISTLKPPKEVSNLILRTFSKHKDMMRIELLSYFHAFEIARFAGLCKTTYVILDPNRFKTKGMPNLYLQAIF